MIDLPTRVLPGSLQERICGRDRGNYNGVGAVASVDNPLVFDF